MPNTRKPEFYYAYATERRARGERFAVAVHWERGGSSTVALFEDPNDAKEFMHTRADRDMVPASVMPSVEVAIMALENA